MKKFSVRILGVLCSLALMSGCGGQKPVETAKPDGTVNAFKVPVTMDFKSLSPDEDISASSKEVLRNMNEALYKYDTVLNTPVFSMAETVDITNNNVYQIVLKDNLKFHNGEDVKASDIKYSYERLTGANPDFTGVSQTWVELLDPASGAGIEVLNDKELIITFNPEKASSRLPYDLMDAFIVPESVTEEVQRKTPVGAGPYKFVSYTPGNSIEFEVFNEYYGEKPEITNVTFVIIPDDSAADLAYKNGEVDMVTVKKELVDTYESDSNTKIFSSYKNSVHALFMNNVRIFENKNLRQAFNYAIDTERVINLSTNNYGYKLDSHMSPFLSTFYNDKLQNTYGCDVEKAKELLALEGYDQDNRLTLSLKYISENKINETMAMIIKDDLAAVNVDVTLEGIPQDQYLESVYKGGDYDIAILEIIGYADPYRVLSRYLSTSNSNMAKYSNPEFDEVLNSTLTTTTVEEKAELIKNAQQILVDDAAAVFIGDEINLMALNTKFDGYVKYPFAFIDVAAIKVAK